MSADNGIYVLASPINLFGKELEYRVAECQAIDNINYFNQESIETKAFEVLYFGESPIFSNEIDAENHALELEKEISESYFPILEYGISFLPVRSYPFPKMTREEATKIIDEGGKNENY